MTFRSSIYKSFFLLVLLAEISQAQTQQDKENIPTDPQTLILQKSIALMEQGEWQKTLELLNPLIEKYGDTGIKKFGAKFATTYYYKGLCLLKLAQAHNKNADPTSQKQAQALFQDSIISFNQCYSVNPSNDTSNTYRVKSLLLRANAQQSLKKYQQAIESYELFLHQRNNGYDTYNISEFNINLAICLWKKATSQKVYDLTSPDIKRAISLLQQSLINTGKSTPSSVAVVTAIRILTEISITLKDDYILPKVIEYTRITAPQNLLLPVISPHSLFPTLSNLIAKTAQQGLSFTSLQITSLIPEIQLHSEALGLSLPQNASSQSVYLTKAQEEVIAVSLQSRASVLQNNNNQQDLRKALNLYKILIKSYANTPNQALNLYNLARIAAQAEDLETAIQSAQQLLAQHPEHEYTNPALTILLSSLYHSQDYQKAYDLAQETLDLNSTSDTKSSNQLLIESASFIRAASQYYLGNYAAAASLLTQHQNSYPTNSSYNEDTTYLIAATQNQLQNWDTSIPQLRNFISQYNTTSGKKSIYTPFAYYEIAYAQYSLRKPHSASLTLLPFSLDIPFVNIDQKTALYNSQISPTAAILLGNIQLTLGLRNQAVLQYQQAIKLAQATENITARDESYYLIINLLGKPLWKGLSNHRLKETIPYYLDFTSLADSKSSPYYTQILTSSIAALERANPNQQAYSLLKENLFIHNNKPNTPGIEIALDTYLYYLRKEKIPTEEIIHNLSNLATSNSSYHQALILSAQVKAAESAQIRIQDPKLKTEIQSLINKLYQELIDQYRNQDLDNFTLLNIANHLTNNKQPELAQSYYKSIINNNSIIKQTEAQLGLALQLAKSKDDDKQKTAITELSKIIENPFSPADAKAPAQYQLIKIYLQNQNWPKVETNALAYIKYPLSIKTHNIQAYQALALAYDKQEKINSAIDTYTHNWATTFFSIQNSAPALNRACELLWNRNTPSTPAANEGKSDRQLAYETAYKYIRKTKDHYKQRKNALTPETIQTWEKIKYNATKFYLNDTSVKAFNGNP